MLIVVALDVYFIALRAKGWESSKDIGSPAYQCARFAARLMVISFLFKEDVTLLQGA